MVKVLREAQPAKGILDAPLSDLAEVLIQRAGSHRAAVELVKGSGGRPPEPDLERLYEMSKRILGKGSPRDGAAAAAILAEEEGVPAGSRPAFVRRLRDKYEEYEEADGPEIWIRIIKNVHLHDGRAFSAHAAYKLSHRLARSLVDDGYAEMPGAEDVSAKDDE